jgi:hypothetical protein
MTITLFCHTMKTVEETRMTDRIYCQIRVKGHLSEEWSVWFDGLEIDNRAGGEAVLAGPLPDQAALYGVLNRMRDLGLALIALESVDAPTSSMLTGE